MNSVEVMEGVCGGRMRRSADVRWMPVPGMRYRKAMPIPAKADPAAKAGFHDSPAYANAQTVDERLRELRLANRAKPIHLAMDDASYQPSRSIVRTFQLSLLVDGVVFSVSRRAVCCTMPVKDC